MDPGTIAKLLLPVGGLLIIVRRIVIHLRRPRPATARDAAIIKYERLELLGTGMMFLVAGPFLLPSAPARWVVAIFWAGAIGLLLMVAAGWLRDRAEGPGRSLLDRL